LQPLSAVEALVGVTKFGKKLAKTHVPFVSTLAVLARSEVRT